MVKLLGDDNITPQLWIAFRIPMCKLVEVYLKGYCFDDTLNIYTWAVC